jgi:hypothetical protein
MENAPISPQLNRRLDQLTEEIRYSLAQVRRHIEELEQVERADLPSEQTNGDFSALLREALASLPGAAPRANDGQAPRSR